MLCAIPLVLMPLAGRSSFEVAAERATFVQRFRAPEFRPFHMRAYRAPAVLRDPFAIPVRAAAHDVTGMRVVQGASTGIPVPAANVRVTAIVEGADARALVEENGAVRVVRRGDRLGAWIVRSVEPGGVRLTNGSFIAIGREPQ